LTPRRQTGQPACVSATAPASLPDFLRWLSNEAGFPRYRLPAPAERMLLMAVAAAEVEAGDQARERYLVKTRDPARDSALRAHAMRRSQVHFKCDNSAKV
jgi:hypothetical protein